MMVTEERMLERLYEIVLFGLDVTRLGSHGRSWWVYPQKKRLFDGVSATFYGGRNDGSHHHITIELARDVPEEWTTPEALKTIRRAGEKAFGIEVGVIF